MYIANGKIAGNRLGNFTCFNSGGASVVDYFIGDSTVISNTHEMVVETPKFHSKHAPITAKIKINTLTQDANEKLSKAPINFRWDLTSGLLFKNIMKSKESIDAINNLKSTLLNNESTKNLIDVTVNQLSVHLKSAALKSLKLKKSIHKPNKKKKSHKWYDNDCINLKKRIDNLAYLLSNDPKNPYISGKYNKSIKEYNKMIKQKKKNLEITEINSLTKLTNNPSQFWKRIKSIKGNDKVALNLITPTEWYNYYSKLTKINK